MLAHFSAQSEVSQLDVVVLVDEDVSGFDIAMQHLAALASLIRDPAVAVIQGEQQLVADLPDDLLLDIVHHLLGFLQFSAQVATGTVLHNDVNLRVCLVDNAINVTHYVGMLQFLQKVHFGHQLLLLAAAHLLETYLFPHQSLAALLRLHFPHDAEGALADLLERDVFVHYFELITVKLGIYTKGRR